MDAPFKYFDGSFMMSVKWKPFVIHDLGAASSLLGDKVVIVSLTNWKLTLYCIVSNPNISFAFHVFVPGHSQPQTNRCGNDSSQ